MLSTLFSQEFLSTLTSILSNDLNHINALRKSGNIHELRIRTLCEFLTTNTKYLKRCYFSINNQTISSLVHLIRFLRLWVRSHMMDTSNHITILINFLINTKSQISKIHITSTIIG